MRVAHALSLLAVLYAGHVLPPHRERALVAQPNDNRVSAGSLRNGILTVSLEATRAHWYPNGDSLPGREVAAFRETGRAPSVPGPLLRVPEGTHVHVAVLNSLADTLVFRVPALIRGSSNATMVDSIVIPPGERRELRILASATGNFIYRATLPDPVSRALRATGQLVGAIVVDSGTTQSIDRVMVVTLSTDSVTPTGGLAGNIVFAINGLSWPQTERLHAVVGDTVRWRVLNASQDVHPMHLHGFYFRVADFRLDAARPDSSLSGRMAVTQTMPPFSTMSMTWIPERPGNWLFHCHFQLHLGKPQPLDVPPHVVAAKRSVSLGTHANHAMTEMAGLVMGIAVAERRGTRVVAENRGAVRKLRLIAIQDVGFPDTAPSIRFVIEEQGRRTEAGPGFSPTLNLQRGQPVSITVANEMTAPTAVHWHGMELESYFDGVAGLSGTASRLAPMIAPGDSFVASFTPPRAGTFIYHSHSDEPRTHRAGLLGAMIVREGSSTPPRDEVVFFLKASRSRTGNPIDINGQADPDTVVLRLGQTTRLRFIALTVVNPNATVAITTRPDSAFVDRSDSLIVPLLMVAKDGAEIPAAARRVMTTRQNISMGETYDYEFTPRQPGIMRLEVRSGPINSRLLTRVPIVVR